jgi:hypothetical protein
LPRCFSIHAQKHDAINGIRGAVVTVLGFVLLIFDKWAWGFRWLLDAAHASAEQAGVGAKRDTDSHDV